MFWVIRWTDVQCGEDKSIVLEAETQAAAEYAGLKRGIPIVFLGPANEEDVRDARESGLLWKYTPDPRYTCFGRAMSVTQVAFFMAAGVGTALVNLLRF